MYTGAYSDAKVVICFCAADAFLSRVSHEKKKENFGLKENIKQLHGFPLVNGKCEIDVQSPFNQT